MRGMEAATWIRGAEATAPEDSWISSQRWDIGWLIGSAAVVPLVLILVWSGTPSLALNLGVTALVGGPHLFATYLVTYGDRRFRQSHRWLLVVASVVVPALVVYGTLTNFQVLLSVFIFAASFHVLHQNAYLTDIYRRKSELPEAPWARWIDYGVLMLSIYPIAAYKLVHSTFLLGDIQILIPSFLMVPATYYLVWAAFALFLTAWLAKTFWEMRLGVLNRPKTILIAVTSVIAFLVPSAATGERLELAFQSVNAWHSIQYLGIVWFILKVRKERGLIKSRFLSAMSGPGRATRRFYGFVSGVTFGVFGVVLLLFVTDPFGFGQGRFDEYYYMAVLSCLLVHYVLDGYLFTVGNLRNVSADRIPYAMPAARRAA